GKRDHGCRHEKGCRQKDRRADGRQHRKALDQHFTARIGEEEDQKRPQFQRQLQERRDFPALDFTFLRRVALENGMLHQATPAMARAKSLAAKGSRSATPSPTPMKEIGSLCVAEIATRMPPRAV